MIMAEFCYSTRDRSYSETRTYPLGKAPRRVRIKQGKRLVTLYHDLAGEVSSRRPDLRGQQTWPLHSVGASVHPKQIPQFTEHLKRSGVPTQFDPKGRPVFTSPSHQHKALQAMGLFNHDSYRSPKNV